MKGKSTYLTVDIWYKEAVARKIYQANKIKRGLLKAKEPKD